MPDAASPVLPDLLRPALLAALPGSLAALIEFAGALGVAGYCAAALAVLARRRDITRARLLVIEGSLWGLSLKTAASLLKTITVHDWNGILVFAAILALRTVLKRAFAWEAGRLDTGHDREGAPALRD